MRKVDDGKKKKKKKRKKKNGVFSSHYVIASSLPPERRRLNDIRWNAARSCQFDEVSSCSSWLTSGTRARLILRKV